MKIGFNVNNNLPSSFRLQHSDFSLPLFTDPPHLPHHPPSRVFWAEVQNGGIESRQVAHEVYAGAAIEVEVGLTVGVWEAIER